MLTGLVAYALLAADPALSAAPPALPFDEARFMLHVGGRAVGRFLGGDDSAAPTSFGGGLSLGLGVRLWQGLYFEASLGEGVFQNPEPLPSFRHLGPHEPAPVTGAGGLLAGQILLGVRYEVRTSWTMRVRPSVFVGATHLHEATLHDFASEPGKVLAGVSESVRHRTGAQLGLGLRVPFPQRWGRAATRFSGRFDADVGYYFDGAPGRIQAGLGAGLQVVF